MSIEPATQPGQPTPDEIEAKEHPIVERGWKFGFWDCFSDPATCCLSIHLTPEFALLYSLALTLHELALLNSFSSLGLTCSLLLSLRCLWNGPFNIQRNARFMCPRFSNLLPFGILLSRSCPRCYQSLRNEREISHHRIA